MWLRTLRLLLICFVFYNCIEFTFSKPEPNNKLFELSIVHLNDVHARFIETSLISGPCLKRNTSECVGGLARVLTASRQLLQERPNAIFLNAGDFYQGTLWQNIHHWKASVYFMNKLPYDIVTVGNHDFDEGIQGLVPFLQNINVPVVLANINTSKEPTIQGLFKNSSIIKRGNQSIGVIGVIIKTTNLISDTGKIKFLDEVESINIEASKLKANGVNIIIVLSHCGIDIDRTIAASCPDIDVVVGGHSHTFLYTGVPPSNDIAEDKYPIVVKQENTDRTVLIVQALAFTKYLGNLTVKFDTKGEIVYWEGNPILLDSKVEQDPELLKDLKPWEEAVDEVGKTKIGISKSYLNSTYCRAEECNMANLVTDAMVHAYTNKSYNTKYWTYAAIAATNAGGLRANILPGLVTYSDVINVQPFGNTWDVGELRGDDLHMALEESVAVSMNEKRFWGASFVQWSGVKVAYNLSQPAYSRIIDVKVRCQDCFTPKYEDLQNDKWYRIVVPTFIVGRGDNITTIPAKMRNHMYGNLDIPQLIDYIKAISVNFTFEYEKDERLVFLGECCGSY